MSATTRELGIAEAARKAGVTGNAVRKWIVKGDVKATPTFYGRTVDAASLEEFLRRRSERGVPK